MRCAFKAETWSSLEISKTRFRESSYILFGQNKRPNPGSGEQTSLPPGYEGVDRNQQLQRDQKNGSYDTIVGQAVSGVIEAVFDAGYLLNVRVGSDTILRGDNFSNGVPISNQPLQVMTQISLGSGTIVSSEIPAGGSQAIISHTQNSQNMLSSGMPSEEVVKRVQPPSDAMDSETDNSKSGDRIPLKDPSSGKEDKANNMDQPVLIKLAQAVQSRPNENSTSDNSIENQTSKAAEVASGNKLDSVRNLGTEHEDRGTVQSTKPI
ncbi:hypothetical protein TanjilG_02955 [Lupinus angustifolius]|uniref:Uncharacterized protein n=1 Tax=Lupinus angustifolius TaxID=3871 RepID=A0A1J7GZ80_LUPAN|nr:hypothetical protein TanjilG_02955 [Lupinus angustifolius]